MLKVAISTGTRADYFLLLPLMQAVQKHPDMQLQIIASSMHFSSEFGQTYEQIEKDGLTIDEKVEMLISSDSAIGIAKSIGVGVIGFADALNRLKPDTLIVLGDRFESLSIAQTAMIMNIPITHLHGGELSEGSYDDSIRHSITKMAGLHFVSTDVYRNRVIQMGENPSRVFNVGAIGVDRLRKKKFLSSSQLTKLLQFDCSSSYFLVCYHPATHADEDPADGIKNIISTLIDSYEDKILVSYPNADSGGGTIIKEINKFEELYPDRIFTFKSLSDDSFLSVIKNSKVFIGNSSSGIIEAPSLGVLSINVGSRQKGRIKAETVIDSSIDKQDLSSKVAYCISKNLNLNLVSKDNPYEKRDTVSKILEIISSCDLTQPKSFFDASKANDHV